MIDSTDTDSKRRAKSVGVYVVTAVIFAAGCGNSGLIEGDVPVFPVTGKVTFAGKPLPRAVVTLTPADLPPGAKWEAPATGGVTDEDGEFELSTYNAGDGAPAGTYFVTVSCEDREAKRSGGEYPELLPEKYQNPASSGLKVTIREGENDFLELQIVN
ncbi:MAG TPA: carboxypeptidase-like regulatory domain-containing protein [Planctomycetaceae bacterium]